MQQLGCCFLFLVSCPYHSYSKHNGRCIVPQHGVSIHPWPTHSQKQHWSPGCCQNGNCIYLRPKHRIHRYREVSFSKESAEQAESFPDPDWPSTTSYCASYRGDWIG